MTDLPDYLTDQTEDVIRQRMLDSLPSDLDKTEGSYIWDAISPAAIELALAAIWAQEVLRRGFASTTFGEYLDLRCEEHGITRRPAVQSTGQVKFIGVAETLVPAGTRVATTADANTGTSSIEFVTTQDVTLDASGVGYASIQAVNGGVAGNVPAGAINIMATPVSGVSSVTNEAATTGGVDTEDDATLLARYFQRVRSPSAGGNKADYINWALEVQGVGGVSVVPVENGPGTVGVYIIDMNRNPADQTLVDAVQNYIAPGGNGSGEGKAPIGAQVTVKPAIAVMINVSATLVIMNGYNADSVKSAVIDNIQAYIKSLAFADNNDVLYVRIGATILDTPGIQDYSNLTVNGGTSNIAIAPTEVAVLGTVNLS